MDRRALVTKEVASLSHCVRYYGVRYYHTYIPSHVQITQAYDFGVLWPHMARSKNRVEKKLVIVTKCRYPNSISMVKKTRDLV